MNIIQGLLGFLKGLLDWWFVVEPWEQAVRVRLGKHVRLYDAGVYWRIPFFDKLYIQNVRRRVCAIQHQTLTTLDGKVLTVTGSLGYCIVDTLKLHYALHEAESSVKHEIVGLITRYVVAHNADECKADDIVRAVSSEVNARLEKYGLGRVEFFLSGFIASIPTFRLVQDGLVGWDSSVSTRLSTNNGTTVGRPHP